MFKKIILSALVLVVSACMPRGETKTLDESLNIAKDRFEHAMLQNKSNIPAELAGSLNSLSENIKAFSAADSASDLRREGKVIADSLKPLTIKAGYTSRASFDEITGQYVNLSDENSESELHASVAKLLAQRTFHMLAAELETTRFAL